MLQRPKNDLWWPNLWHVPGSVLLPTDTPGTYNNALGRIVGGELGSIDLKMGPTHFRDDFRHEKRGPMNAIQHWSILKNVPVVGRLFPTNQLPEKMVPEHIDTVALAEEAYRKSLNVAD